MKHNIATRLLILMLIVGMIFTMTACGKKEEPESEPTDASDVSDPSDSSDPSESESEPEEPIKDAVEAPTLMEKLAAGIKRNADTVGWLQVPGTTIDDAVMQAKDNEYYLLLTEDKVYSIYGSYFMDFESIPQTTRDKLSKQNIIYGHSDYRDNKDGKDFSQLFIYKDIDHLRANPYIYYSTKDDEMVWQVFAVIEANVDYEKNPSGSFYYLDANPSAKDFTALIDEAKARSRYIIDVPVTGTDKILTLSTCTANRANRFVIMAKLLPAGKQLAPTMAVELNPSPRT